MWMPQAIESRGCFGGIHYLFSSWDGIRLSETWMKPSIGLEISLRRLILESGRSNWGKKEGNPLCGNRQMQRLPDRRERL